jgi:hypothetical protein
MAKETLIPVTLISVKEAAAQGIKRLRHPKWANPRDYIKIDIVDGEPGPWLRLYSPINISVCQQENPQTVLWAMAGGRAAIESEEYLPYTGEIDPDEQVLGGRQP